MLDSYISKDRTVDIMGSNPGKKKIELFQ